MVEARQHRPDDPRLTQPRDHLRRDLRRIEARHDEHIRVSGQPAERVAAAEARIQRHLRTQFALEFEIHATGLQQPHGRGDPLGALGLWLPEGRMRTQRDPRALAERTHAGGARNRNGGELLRGRFPVDEGIRHQQCRVLRHHHREAERHGAGLGVDGEPDRLQRLARRAGEAGDEAIRVAERHRAGGEDGTSRSR